MDTNNWSTPEILTKNYHQQQIFIRLMRPIEPLEKKDKIQIYDSLRQDLHNLLPFLETTIPDKGWVISTDNGDFVFLINSGESTIISKSSNFKKYPQIIRALLNFYEEKINANNVNIACISILHVYKIKVSDNPSQKLANLFGIFRSHESTALNISYDFTVDNYDIALNFSSTVEIDGTKRNHYIIILAEIKDKSNTTNNEAVKNILKFSDNFTNKDLYTMIHQQFNKQ